MTMTDPIADMLTRIRNAYSMKHESVTFPASKIKMGICKVLMDEGYISDAVQNSENNISTIEVMLKYGKYGKAIVHEIKRVSKPGRRVYVESEKIGKYKGGLGISIISTSRGIISDRMAKKENIGGELLCKVW